MTAVQWGAVKRDPSSLKSRVAGGPYKHTEIQPLNGRNTHNCFAQKTGNKQLEASGALERALWWAFKSPACSMQKRKYSLTEIWQSIVRRWLHSEARFERKHVPVRFSALRVKQTVAYISELQIGWSLQPCSRMRKITISAVSIVWCVCVGLVRRPLHKVGLLYGATMLRNLLGSSVAWREPTGDS